MFGLASPNISIWPWRLELRRDLLYPRKPVLDEEEEERDLGFAAAQDEDALRKKVIVEKYFPQLE